MDEATSDVGSRDRTWLVVTVTTVAAVALIVLVAFLLVPRTVASGGEGDAAWRVRIAPLSLALAPTVTVEDASDGSASVTSIDGLRAPHRLADTVLVAVGRDAAAETLVIGPTPAAVASVRVTSDRHGVGEARAVRVGWRRFHLARLSGGVEAVELVGIDDQGAVVDVAVVTAEAAADGAPAENAAGVAH